jgi:hypothetical protein
MNVVPVFKAHGDGGNRGIGPVVGVATSEYKAREIARGKGFFGSDGSVTEGFAIDDGRGKLYLLEKTFPFVDGEDRVEAARKAKAEALAKLTDEDKRILGLT